MKLDVEQQLCGLDGKPIPQTGEKGSPPTTLKDICLTVLVNELPSDREKATGDEKFKRYILAGRINKGGVVEVDAKEIDTLKERIGKGYGAVIVGPAWLLLESLKS